MRWKVYLKELLTVVCVTDEYEREKVELKKICWFTGKIMNNAIGELVTLDLRTLRVSTVPVSLSVCAFVFAWTQWIFRGLSSRNERKRQNGSRTGKDNRKDMENLQSFSRRTVWHRMPGTPNCSFLLNPCCPSAFWKLSVTMKKRKLSFFLLFLLPTQTVAHPAHTLHASHICVAPELGPVGR